MVLTICRHRATTLSSDAPTGFSHRRPRRLSFSSPGRLHEGCATCTSRLCRPPGALRPSLARPAHPHQFHLGRADVAAHHTPPTDSFRRVDSRQSAHSVVCTLHPSISAPTLFLQLHEGRSALFRVPSHTFPESFVQCDPLARHLIRHARQWLLRPSADFPWNF